jgi:precorrin-2 dehydrogenase/sirohydrochlorin ferrochelatase
MRYYPVSLDISNRACVVIGGGAVAIRKVNSLLKAGALVTVICPEAAKELTALAVRNKINLIRRGYKKGDLKGAFLAVSATGEQAINKAVFAEAKKRNVLINVVDAPDLCTFIVPSVVEKGPLTLAVSTSGKSPLFAKALRQELEKKFGREYAVFTELLGAVRSKLLKEGLDYDKKEKVINRLIKSPLLGFLKRGDACATDKFLNGIFGKGVTLKKLGVNFKGKA